MRTTGIGFVLVGVVLLLVLGAGPARATPITFVGSSVTPDGLVSASATFTFGSGTITIDLTNTQTGIVSVGQTISGLWFETSAPADLGTTSMSSSSGQIASIDGATHSFNSLGVESPLKRWHLTTPATSLIALGGGQPDRLIMSTDLNGALNGSFRGQFNPFVLGTAHFVINAPSATASTTVTAVTFMFGTAGEYHVPGVPEPASLLLLGSGLAGLGGLARRRLRHKS